VAAVATVLTSLALAGAARAEEPDESSKAEEEALAPPRKPEPPPPPPAAPATAAAPASEAFIEHMGPETYPGRLRGIYGGSLWMEPDFQGLQWPQNTRTGLGISRTSGSIAPASGFAAAGTCCQIPT